MRGYRPSAADKRRITDYLQDRPDVAAQVTAYLHGTQKRLRRETFSLLPDGVSKLAGPLLLRLLPDPTRPDDYKRWVGLYRVLSPDEYEEQMEATRRLWAPRTMTTNKAAAALGVSKSTVRRWKQAEKLGGRHGSAEIPAHLFMLRGLARLRAYEDQPRCWRRRIGYLVRLLGRDGAATRLCEHRGGAVDEASTEREIRRWMAGATPRGSWRGAILMAVQRVTSDRRTQTRSKP